MTDINMQSTSDAKYRNKDSGKSIAIFGYIFLAVAVIAALGTVIIFEYPGLFS